MIAAIALYAFSAILVWFWMYFMNQIDPGRFLKRKWAM